MGIGCGTPCCDCGVCDGTGETTWADDFSGYSAGEDLTSYGYLENGSGDNSIRTVASETITAATATPATAWRETQFDYKAYSLASFEFEYILGGIAAGQIGRSMFKADLGTFGTGLATNLIEFTFNSSQTAFTVYNNTKQTSGTTVAANDIILITMEVTSVTATDVNITGKAYINAVEEFSQTATVPRSVDWCSGGYGVQGIAASPVQPFITDNWDFDLT